MSLDKAVKLRPMLGADIPVLAVVFADSVAELTGEYYDDEQRAAWIETSDDLVAFASHLNEALTLVATRDGAPVGFVSMGVSGMLTMLYVHPTAVGGGVASALLDAVERLAKSRGEASLGVEASDNARSFFDARGFKAERRQTAMRGDTWFGNTLMRKRLD